MNSVNVNGKTSTLPALNSLNNFVSSLEKAKNNYKKSYNEFLSLDEMLTKTSDAKEKIIAETALNKSRFNQKKKLIDIRRDLLNEVINNKEEFSNVKNDYLDLMKVYRDNNEMFKDLSSILEMTNNEMLSNIIHIIVVFLQILFY